MTILVKKLQLYSERMEKLIIIGKFEHSFISKTIQVNHTSSKIGETRPLPRYVSPAEYRRGRNTTLKFFPFA